MSDSPNSAGDRFTLQPDTTGTSESLRLEPAEMDAKAAVAEKQPSYGWAMVRELVETVVLSLVIFLLIRQVVQNYRIENHSMEPSFFEGQFVLVNKLAYRLGQPDRGDVLVFHNPRNTNEDYIKRIIGLPGDTVEISNQTVFINGAAVLENFTHHPIPPGEYSGPFVVGDNQLFVMGDNRPNSSDSRVFGSIDQDLVVGQAWLRIWPLNECGFVQHIDLPLAGTPVPQ